VRPEQRPDARDELGQLERLRHVVVGAELKADDDVDRVAARRQHQHGHAARAPDLPADLEPVELRQHHVEDDKVVRLAPKAREPVPPVRRRLDRQAGLPQPERGDLPNRGVVLDEDHALAHGATLGRFGSSFVSGA
jgi:hypothetical protein